MKPNKICHFQLYILLLALAFVLGDCDIGFLRKYHVRIQNGLRNKTMDVHCKSKDDDLGRHTLSSYKIYEFSFRANYFRSTLFFCNLWYRDHHVVFDAFTTDVTLLDKCGGDSDATDCNWKGQEDGVYLLNTASKKWNFMYHWGHKK
ncbi:unnamed protein product [Dovyalis caffra]|uniref:S-protein homolog n=1 Tax=Dovyalis caffra TaxID=77055 RepID=A0AAV1SDM6_9ROSI|nr:unnamed protein product [Dovyalis caffra]